jgi:hypothetical protein
MLYRIKAGQCEWVVVSHTLALVMNVVRRKAKDFPVGQEFEIFRGNKLVAAHRREPLFDPMPPDLLG